MSERRPKVVAVIQARMSSARLPGKVLQPLAGEPMLHRVVERVRAAHHVDRPIIDETIVATSNDASDDPLQAWCEERGVRCVRGSLHDVLARYQTAAVVAEADVIVRITSDCPLIDPSVTGRVIAAYLAADPPVAYASNTDPTRTYPRGLDVEVFSAEALGIAHREDDNPAWREHVTQFLCRQPERFPRTCVTADEDASAHRWTVDTPEDLELVRRIYDHFAADGGVGPTAFDWRDVLALLAECPDWAELNRHVEQKKVA
ncbi:cytidylyltransferase domain-containing protein [Alienimonas californiensis]|uniref:3-deoxy-manno-octulosonate cytidylyltransferase n=1 Tax=Alienimonas californiensis TaxID=2527989 RepID=A0A517P859_9PLAN|nr:glycosyltransferase family protein [Alienimonas californiensis]QDT15553.1 3-deoxy-manno-octulosonate cytidylyltransferase [Alienimonas californiensis]